MESQRQSGMNEDNDHHQGGMEFHDEDNSHYQGGMEFDGEDNDHYQGGMHFDGEDDDVCEGSKEFYGEDGVSENVHSEEEAKSHSNIAKRIKECARLIKPGRALRSPYEALRKKKR